ncbi:unnamed protein product [Symbiodinium sp. CCMP2592]|nr:unnamed protein product [Symbiodinium sp. CCMP2592]
MADQAAEPEVKPCDVLSAWEKSKTVMNRLMQGCLVHLPPDTKKIKRDHLAENVELLGPLIKNVGLRMSAHVLAEYFKRFYLGYRPMNLRMPTSSSMDGETFDHMLFPARETATCGSAAADDDENDSVSDDEAAESEAEMEDDAEIEVEEEPVTGNASSSANPVEMPDKGAEVEPSRPTAEDSCLKHIYTLLRSIVFISGDRDTASSHPGKEPLSPRSQAKQRREHYLVQDRAYGYLCVLCGNNAKEPGILRAKKCFPLPDLKPLDEHLEKASKSSKASGSGSPRPSPTEALSEVTPKQASMMEELAFLQKQQAKLEELLKLQELEDFERALQEEEEQLQAALRRSELEAEEAELNRKRSRPADDTIFHAAEAPASNTAKPTDCQAIPASSFEARLAAASEAPPAIMEPTKAEPHEVFFDPKNELEMPPSAIVEPSQADPDVAPKNEVEVPPRSNREAIPSSPDLLDTVPEEPLFYEKPPATLENESEELLGTCKRLEVPLVTKGPEAPQAESAEVVQPTSVSLRIEPLSDAEEGEEELPEDDVLIDVNSEGKLQSKKAHEGQEEDTKLASPSKATVFYDRHLPPCPIESDHKPATPAEQRLAVGARGDGPGRGRGRGRGRKGSKGRGRGRSSGKGKGRGGRGRASDEVDEEEDESDCEEETEPPRAKAAPKRSASTPKAKAAPKSKRSKDPAPKVNPRGPSNKRKAEDAAPKANPPSGPSNKCRVEDAAPEVNPPSRPANKRKAEDPAPEVNPPSLPANKGRRKDPVPKAGPKAKAKVKASAKRAASKPNNTTDDAEAEKKAQKSRKSVAYHRAVKQAKEDGMTEEECKQAGKQVWLLALHRHDKLLSENGHNVASYDRLYGQPMDFTSNAGFAFHALQYVRVYMCLVCAWMIDQILQLISSEVYRQSFWYIDKAGKHRYVGKTKLLKDSGIYTRTFGENLLYAFDQWCKLPPADRADVRGRRHVDLGSSDKEIFAALETDDLWLDARVHETFLYLYGSKNCKIPDSWCGVMENFKDEVMMKACGDERLRSELQQLSEAAPGPSQSDPNQPGSIFFKFKGRETELSMESYDSAVEDAQNPNPKLDELLNMPVANSMPPPKKSPKRPLQGVDGVAHSPSPKKPALALAVPAEVKPTATPPPKGSQSSQSPGPSLSERSTPAPAPKPGKRGKSPTYWRPDLDQAFCSVCSVI